MKLYLLMIITTFCLNACNNDATNYNGYIDADLTYLSSDFSGNLQKLYITRGQQVESGQLLFKLEQSSEQYNVAASYYNNANLMAQKNAIISQIKYAQKNFDRLLSLNKQNSASKDEVDIAQQNLSVLKNQLAGIKAQINANNYYTAQKEWQLQRKEGFAPESGIIFDTYYNSGEFVSSGQPILSLISQANIKVIFFVPETDLAKIKLNEQVKVICDGNSSPLLGKINYISNEAQYTPPIIFSREDRHKLVFKVEAKLIQINLNQIHWGQPVSLEISK